MSLESLFSVRNYLPYTCTCYWYVLMMDLRWRETARMGKVFRKAGHVNYTERKPRMTEGSVERNCVPVSSHCMTCFVKWIKIPLKQPNLLFLKRFSGKFFSSWLNYSKWSQSCTCSSVGLRKLDLFLEYVTHVHAQRFLVLRTEDILYRFFNVKKFHLFWKMIAIYINW